MSGIRIPSLKSSQIISSKKHALSAFEEESNERKLVKLDDEDEISNKQGFKIEEDPLDLFMSNIQDKIEQEDLNKKLNKDIIREDVENEDSFLESYYAELEKNETSDNLHIDHSDEEAHAATNALDNECYDSDDHAILSAKKKDIDALVPVDHSIIQYLEFEKNFYFEHEEIRKLNESQLDEIRKKFDIRVTGKSIAKPIISFAHLGLDEALLEIIRRLEYVEPTSIQKQTLPVALSGRDIVAIAQTGSGKTASYLIPLMIHTIDQPELSEGEGPIGLVLAPTRELVQQIYQEAKKFAKAYNLNVVALYGGTSKLEQFKLLKHGYVDIIISTPARLIDMVKMKATQLRRVTFVILDEVDMLFSLGTEIQVRSILSQVRPDRQMLLFSATLTPKIESEIIHEFMSDPVKIIIGVNSEKGRSSMLTFNENIKQWFIILNNEKARKDWMVNNLNEFSLQGSALIFVNTKIDVVNWIENAAGLGVKCSGLHGDLSQFERDRIIKEFKFGKTPLLFSTDLASRGLDIPDVKMVINLTAPKDLDTYIHRIGRTGRAGSMGIAYTILLDSNINEESSSKQNDTKIASFIVRWLESNDRYADISRELLNLAMKDSNFKKGKNVNLMKSICIKETKKPEKFGEKKRTRWSHSEANQLASFKSHASVDRLKQSFQSAFVKSSSGSYSTLS